MEQEFELINFNDMTAYCAISDEQLCQVLQELSEEAARKARRARNPVTKQGWLDFSKAWAKQRESILSAARDESEA